MGDDLGRHMFEEQKRFGGRKECWYITRKFAMFYYMCIYIYICMYVYIGLHHVVLGEDKIDGQKRCGEMC